ncbi:MAG TPA: hypothetical protein VFW33_07955 [Gemmataceae bacterium]|nr:hypothetical protein [Gemmataceae bacterium]
MQLAHGQVQHGVWGRHGRGPRLHLLAAAGAVPGVAGQAVSHAVEPAGHGVGLADGGGFPGQEQEGGLEGVLGVVGVRQRAMADGEHHRAVPPDELGEGRLVTARDEVPDEPAVGHASRPRPHGQAAEVAHEVTHTVGGHA